MLVLSRKVDQKLFIGDNIEITIVSVSGDTVRIGIEAPKDIKILRSEVYEEIQQQNIEAVSSSQAENTETKEKLKKLLDAKLQK